MLGVVEQLMHSTIRIECRDSQGRVSSGTGFLFSFLEHEGRTVPAIVTNKHVVEGSKEGLFYLSFSGNDGDPDYGSHEPVRVNDFEQMWLPHPDRDVDLAICLIGGLLNDLAEKGKKVFLRSLSKNLLPTADQLKKLGAMEEISEAQFCAIGHVILQWAFLENEIDRELIWLNEQSDDPVRLGAKFETRAERWRRMAGLTYEQHPLLVAEVETISHRANEIKIERDKLAHCNISSSGILFRIRQGQIIEVSDTGTPAEIEELACRIADITAELDRHQARLEQIFQTSL